jgi:type IV secretory pathway VirB10-like protein
MTVRTNLMKSFLPLVMVVVAALLIACSNTSEAPAQEPASDQTVEPTPAPAVVLAPEQQPPQEPEQEPEPPITSWPRAQEATPVILPSPPPARVAPDDCQPPKHRDNDGNCVDSGDKPENDQDKKCHIECMCYEGESPTSETSCSPCTQVGGEVCE